MSLSSEDIAGSIYFDDFSSSRWGHIGAGDNQSQMQNRVGGGPNSLQPLTPGPLPRGEGATPAPTRTPTPTPTRTPTPSRSAGLRDAQHAAAGLPLADLRPQANLILARYDMPARMQDAEPVSRTITYTYDPLYRLTEANYSNNDYFHYTYDAVGNRLSQESSVNGLSSTVSYQYDTANRLAQVDNTDYVWDDNGNLLEDGTNTYTYDAANQLINVTQDNNTYAYSYSGLGDRLQQIANGQTTDYTLDLDAGLTQVLDDGTDTYLYGVDRLAQVNTAPEYFLGDALGSVRQLADDSAEIALAQSYDPYGNIISNMGNGTSVYAFAGEATDPTGLSYLRARYYSPQQARFLSRDTWEGDYELPQSLNRWNYTQSNPINYTDPSGHCIFAGVDTVLCAALVGAGAGFLVGIAAGELFGHATYEEALAGQCGCEMQQQATSAGGRWRYANTMALTAGILGGVGGAIAVAAPIGMAIVGAGGIIISGVDAYKTYNIIVHETGITKCTILRGLFDLAGILGGIAAIKAWRANGSWLRWGSSLVNSKGVAYPDVQISSYGKVPFPDGPYEPNNTGLRSEFTQEYKLQFKQWWIEKGRPWPSGQIEIHHIKPLQFGGTNAFQNLVPLNTGPHLEFTLWWWYFVP